MTPRKTSPCSHGLDMNSKLPCNMYTNLVLVLLAVCSFSLAQTNSASDPLTSQINNCLSVLPFYNKSLPNGGLTDLTGQGATTVNLKYLQSICQNPDAYISATKCMFAALASDPFIKDVQPNIIPDATQLQESITYLCSKQKDIDFPCLANGNINLSKCITDRILNDSDSLHLNTSQVVCRSVDIALNCTYQGLSACPVTRDIYVSMVEKYQIPKGCQKPTVTSIEASTHRPTESLNTQISECMSAVPFYNSSLPDGGLSSVLTQNGLMANHKFLEYVCQNQKTYFSALKCMVAAQSSHDNLKGVDSQISPNLTQLTESISYICSNLKEIDYPCLENGISALSRCVNQRASKVPSNLSTSAVICRSFEIAINCTYESLSACPVTRAIYLKAYDLYIPKTCQNTTVSRTGPIQSCNKTNDRLKNCVKGFPFLNNLQGKELLNAVVSLTWPSSTNRNTMCQDVDGFHSAVRCVYAEVNSPDACYTDYQDHLPVENDVTEGVSFICRRQKDIDHNCINANMSALVRCIKEGITKLPLNQTDLQTVCATFPVEDSCLKQSLISCPVTRNILVTLSHAYQIPKGCTELRSQIVG